MYFISNRSCSRSMARFWTRGTTKVSTLKVHVLLTKHETFFLNMGTCVGEMFDWLLEYISHSFLLHQHLSQTSPTRCGWVDCIVSPNMRKVIQLHKSTEIALKAGMLETEYIQPISSNSNPGFFFGFFSFFPGKKRGRDWTNPWIQCRGEVYAEARAGLGDSTNPRQPPRELFMEVP